MAQIVRYLVSAKGKETSKGSSLSFSRSIDNKPSDRVKNCFYKADLLLKYLISQSP